MYDVLNDTLVDVAIAPMATDERILALQHINATKDLCPNDKKLNVYDRGYASFDFTNFNLAIDAQTKSDSYVWLEKDGKHLGKKAFKKLYFSWPIETKYGVIKKKLQLDNFSAKSVEGVQQEFFASMYLANCSSKLQSRTSDFHHSQKI